MWQRIELEQEQSDKYEQEAIEYRYKYEELQKTIINNDLSSLKFNYNALQAEIQQLKQQLGAIEQNRQELLQGIKKSFQEERKNINQFKSEIAKQNTKRLTELESRLLKRINEKSQINNLTSLSPGDKKTQPQKTNASEEQNINNVNHQTSIQEQAISVSPEEQNLATELITGSKTNLTDEETKIVESYNLKLDLADLFDLLPVSPTKDSINQRRSGTITTYFEIDSRLGNYLIITGKEGQYLVPKSNLRMTKHNIESLMYFFHFQSDKEIETEEIDSFILIQPGIVVQQESKWQLKDRGLLGFISKGEGGGSEN